MVLKRVYVGTRERRGFELMQGVAGGTKGR